MPNTHAGQTDLAGHTPFVDLTPATDPVAHRYGEPGGTGGAVLPPTIELQLNHRSVRKFLTRPVSDAQIDLVITAAQSASQSSNLQVWSVVAVRDDDRKRRISAFVGRQSYIEDSSVFLVWVADFRRAANVAEAQGVSAETLGYIENTLVTAVDSGIAAQNALVAAESLGLGGVFVGALRSNPEAIIHELGLPDYTFPLFGVALGYPDPSEQAGIKPRLPRPAVLHRERYDPAAWLPAAEVYEDRIQEYFAEHGRDDYSWADTLTKRIGTVAGLHGRDSIRGALTAQGFASE
jgi:nitroreductase